MKKRILFSLAVTAVIMLLGNSAQALTRAFMKDPRQLQTLAKSNSEFNLPSADSPTVMAT